MCEYVYIGGGNFAIVCGGHGRRALCQFCKRNAHTKLCDGDAGGRTCDRKMCDACATNVGPDRDLCPICKRGDTVKLPATREAIKQGGYKFEFARPCKRCGTHLEFYRTPAKALLPLEAVIVDGVWLMDSHFKTCPFRDEFKKASAAPVAKPDQGDLFEGEK